MPGIVFDPSVQGYERREAGEMGETVFDMKMVDAGPARKDPLSQGS